jgi:hypothetical protein
MNSWPYCDIGISSQESQKKFLEMALMPSALRPVRNGNGYSENQAKQSSWTSGYRQAKRQILEQ